MRLIDATTVQELQNVLDNEADEKETIAYKVFEQFSLYVEERPTIDAVPVEVLATIAFYNGHLDWLRDLADTLEQLEEGEKFMNPVPINEWCSERHMFWEILVGMFGDWGTSIRSGWIEKTKEAAAFIKKLIEEERKE